MKTKLVALIFLVFSALSCKKEIVEVPDNTLPVKFGTVNCVFDDVQWDGSVETVQILTNSNEKPVIHFFKPEARVNFYFAGFDFKVGRYPVFSYSDTDHKDGVKSVLHFGAGDVIEGSGDIINLDFMENYFEITNINLTKKEIEGNFQVAYAGQKEFNEIELPVIVFDSTTNVYDTIYEIHWPVDTFVLKEGKFRTFLK